MRPHIAAHDSKFAVLHNGSVPRYTKLLSNTLNTLAYSRRSRHQALLGPLILMGSSKSASLLVPVVRCEHRIVLAEKGAVFASPQVPDGALLRIPQRCNATE